ncbi:MAG: hypothetical protein D3924_15920 [Candidatus Electrothrix sp. AR4]|nr:hypothetical protein [Candidatus Electrothrix sp. AR4]
MFGLDRLYDCLARIAGLADSAGSADSSESDAGQSVGVIGKKDRKKISSLRQRFESAMDNDFNTAQALGHLFDGVKALNRATGMLAQTGSIDDLALVQQAGADVRELAGLLGLLQHDPEEYMRQKKEELLAAITLSEEEITALIDKRNAARKEKDWAASDAVRDELLAHNIELHDGPDGTTWDVKA